MLSGPPGSAKESAVRSICKELKLDVNEWKNQPNTDSYTVPTSMNIYDTLLDEECAQFANFIHKSTLYTRGVVLIKEFPHKFETNKDQLEQVMIKEMRRIACSNFILSGSYDLDKAILRKIT